MGRTVPSYRMALEFEIERWCSFKKALPKEEDMEAFEELMDVCRDNAMASGNACNPVIFEPMMMSILLFQQERLWALEDKLNALRARQAGLKVVKAQERKGLLGLQTQG